MFASKIDRVLQNLKLIASSITNFGSMKTNDTNRLHLLMLRSKETLFGIIIDEDLHFKIHLESLCKKVSRNLGACSQIVIFMHPEK